MFRRDSVALVFVILLAIVVSMVIAAVLAFYHNQQNSNRIQPGVFIKGINVSGLTKEEATRLVQEDLKVEDLLLRSKKTAVIYGPKPTIVIYLLCILMTTEKPGTTSAS